MPVDETVCPVTKSDSILTVMSAVLCSMHNLLKELKVNANLNKRVHFQNSAKCCQYASRVINKLDLKYQLVITWSQVSSVESTLT